MFGLKLNIDARHEEVEPNGEKCACCGQPIFLKAWAFRVFVNKKDLGLLDARWCEACRNLMEVGA